MIFLQETHIMHTFDKDFYGEELSVCVAGYIRSEKKFNSLGNQLCINQASYYYIVEKQE